MNVDAANFHRTPAQAGAEHLLIDRGASFMQRTARVAAAAADEADEVDRTARFPRAAIDAARREKLLGMQIPTDLGGPLGLAHARARRVATGAARATIGA